jgi:uncharacterized membrane protein HdeD (DUF308 family)
VNVVDKGRFDGRDIDELEGLRESRGLLLGMGLALILLGAVAIGSSIIAVYATVVVFGVLLLVGAIFQFFTAFWGRRWRGSILHLLAGVLYCIAGVFMIENPVAAAVGLTLLVAACLLVGGIFRIVLSVAERFDGWHWMLLNGVIAVLLGVSIWRQWPLSGLWVIGLFVGIEMLLSGFSWVMFGLAVDSKPKGLSTYNFPV